MDVMVDRRVDGTLGHCIYRKPIHTDRYLHKICEPTAIEKELSHLTNVFQANGFSKQEIKRAFHPKVERQPPEEEPAKSTAYLPYVEDVTERIERLLSEHHIKTVFKAYPSHQRLSTISERCERPLSAAGVYKILCSCGSAYIGTTKRSVNTRMKEHQRNCRLGHTEKSAVAVHIFSDGTYDIKFKETKTLSRTSRY
ncbi:uncharacterized protein LOC129219166 [Uloborus diversus]|uniref:uncharacterized protein LOC129219166 n=1 Tax=Uloborus diversus TaxID=327109 RepID=UPI00240A78AD|nr:uncharacterized protein LOC129219166 [Uloborus diversus]